MQIILIAFLLYFLYRFVFGFMIPIVKTAGHVKQQFNAMKNQMGGDNTKDDYEPKSYQSNASSMPNNYTDSLKKRSTSGKKGSKEDYIEFEEIA